MAVFTSEVSGRSEAVEVLEVDGELVKVRFEDGREWWVKRAEVVSAQ
jgi:sRNA-binding carbon storage regulator CsrA